ncbi:hypothetical protein L1987_64968 [Smallanthus sonchifolius]|uniref:Uncharacterized protein n=1 Tax=Smallanthus sonchifolius TaxID=185202 RepID=A0ACB9BT81_9ASTR|nr:hypothetical protein L1987_64968 [Smallanthus sonchifolius]
MDLGFCFYIFLHNACSVGFCWLFLFGADMAAKPLRLTDGVFEEQSAAYCLYDGRKCKKKKGDKVLLTYGT